MEIMYTCISTYMDGLGTFIHMYKYLFLSIYDFFKIHDF